MVMGKLQLPKLQARPQLKLFFLQIHPTIIFTLPIHSPLSATTPFAFLHFLVIQQYSS